MNYMQIIIANNNRQFFGLKSGAIYKIVVAIAIDIFSIYQVDLSAASPNSMSYPLSTSTKKSFPFTRRITGFIITFSIRVTALSLAGRLESCSELSAAATYGFCSDYLFCYYCYFYYYCCCCCCCYYYYYGYVFSGCNFLGFCFSYSSGNSLILFKTSMSAPSLYSGLLSCLVKWSYSQ